MSVRGLRHSLRPLEILTEGEVEGIHRGTLRVLAETGVTFEDERALNLLSANGCQVDVDRKRVKFPNELVEDCLSNCLKTFRVRARDPENDLVLGSGDTIYFKPSAGMETLDIDTWEPREPTRKEFYDYITVLDALPNVHMQPAFPYFGFAKVPQCMRLIESNAGKIRRSTKVQQEGSVLNNNIWNIEMAKATGQEILGLVNPAAPLTYFENTVSDLYKYIEEDMPFHFSSGSIAGSTGPATTAGVLITNNAEILSGIVLAQLIKPGTRLWVGSMIMAQNMRTGSPAFGAIENSLSQMAFNQVWRKFKLPTFSSPTGWTSSKAIDYQAGYEISMAALLCALSGASVISLHGGLTAQLTAHPVKAVLDDDIAGMIGHLLKGVEVSEETMAIDLINKVGPIPGHFLTTPHTREWWRKEQFMPKVADRLPFPEWTRLGKKKAIDHARERVEEILSTHKISPLPAKQEEAIEDILIEARKYYKKSGKISDEEWGLYQEDINSPQYPYG